MVFARTKLVLEDNCFEEEPGSVTVNFVGPQVSRIYKRSYDLIKAVFKVADSDIQETEYSWAKTEKGDNFKITWWVHVDLDLFSYLYLRFRLTGSGEEKSGRARLEIRGLLRSEYPQDTLWQRSLLYEMLRTFWHRVFYHKKREEFAEDCRNSIILYMQKIKEFYEKLREAKG